MKSSSLVKWLKDNAWLASWVEAFAIIAALVIALVQLDQVAQGLSQGASQAATERLFSQQHEVNSIFMEYTELQPYFFEGEPLPSPDGSDATVTLRRRAYAAAGELLDFFEQVRFLIVSGDFRADVPAWEAYIGDSFAMSPVLCSSLRARIEWYGGKKELTLWSLFAAERC